MATNISFQILSLGNSAEQLHHWISHVIKLHNHLFWRGNSPTSTVPIQIILSPQDNIQTYQKHSRIYQKHSFPKACLTSMLVQYKTLPFILKGHSLHKSET